MNWPEIWQAKSKSAESVSVVLTPSDRVELKKQEYQELESAFSNYLKNEAFESAPVFKKENVAVSRRFYSHYFIKSLTEFLDIALNSAIDEQKRLARIELRSQLVHLGGSSYDFPGWYFHLKGLAMVRL